MCLCSLFGGSDYKLIYRHYATLYFVFCVDSSESELGILDLIQVGLSAVRFTAQEWLAGTSPHSTVLAGRPGPNTFQVHCMSVAPLCWPFWKRLRSRSGGCDAEGELRAR